MGKKKGFLLTLSAALTAISICLGTMPFTADASEMKREYGVTGKIISNGPIFNDETTVEIANGYYIINPHSSWSFFSCESKDGTLKFQYFLERDNVYRFIVMDQEKTTVYSANDGGILDNNGDILGTAFKAEGYQLDFSNLTFTEAKERFPAGIYEGTGTNSLDADYILVKAYNAVIDIDFYKSGELIANIGGNYAGINAEGTITFTHDYEGVFTGRLANDGKLCGSFIPESKEKQIEFDLQLKEANTIKSGSYVSKGNYPKDIDEIRIHFIDMNFTLELMKAGNVIKLYEVALNEIKQDGTLVLESYYGNDTISDFAISSDGTVTGKLYDDYNIDLNMSLTKINETS
ncbi:hypothetical protein [Lacrimispora brassicae]